MLRAEENEILTRVGPGTLMGDLLRRYWTPACLSAEIPEPDSPPARVRLLGENLVAFRDTSGRVGLVQEYCPHRGASLFFGRNEERGAALRLPRLEVRRRRQLRRHADRAGAVLREGQDAGLPDPRVRRHRLDLHGPARDDDAVPGLRHRRARRSEFIAAKLLLDLQLGAGDGGQPRHGPHLLPAPVRRDRRHPRRRLRQARLPVERDVVEVLAPRPRAALEVDDTWFGFRYAGIRTTPNGNTHVRVTAFVLPYSTLVASHPVQRRPRDVRADRRRELLALLLTPAAAAEPARARRREPLRVAPFSTPITEPSTGGIIPRLYTADNDYQIDREIQATASSAASPTSSART